MSIPFALPLRLAWRSLRRTPAFTVTATLTLIIGMGATVAIFALINAVLLRPLPYANPDRLVGAWHDMAPLNLKHAEQTSATYFTYRKLARTIDDIGLYQQSEVNVARPGSGTDPERVGSAWITASLIPVFGVTPTLGRSFNAAEDAPNGPHSVIISETFWRNHFGADPRVVGRTLEVNGLTREIVGVMPRDFRFPAPRTQIWLPLGLDANDPFPGGFSYNAVARLKPGVTLEAAQRDFATVLPRIVELSPNLAPGVSTQMMLDQAKPSPVLIPLREDLVGDFARTLWIVGAAAGLVLLVACFNVANLILVRADSRQRELAVREALGAGWARVMTHFLAEAVVLAIVAGAAGLTVAAIAVRALVLGGTSAAERIAIPRLSEVHIDAAAVGFTIVLVVLVAAVCSIIPALRIGRISLANALREGGRGGTSGRVQQRVRGALVAGQIALALVVLSGSGLLMRTFSRLQRVELGFRPEQLATVWLSLPAARYPGESTYVRFYSQLLDRVTALPGVRAVGLTSRVPLVERGQNNDPFYAEGDESATSKIPHLQLFTTVDGGYFRAMGIPLLAGHTFDRLERQKGEEAIISRATAVQFYHDSTGQAALGKRFRELPGSPWVTIIGVVGDARDTALTAAPAQTVYFPESVNTDTLFDQTARTMALVIRTSGDPAAMTTPVQRIVREMDPTLPTFDARPMTVVLSNSMARLSFTILILGSAALVTLVLGVVGLYGVMAYLVALRTRELGLRIALGAQPGAVAVMLTRHGLWLTAGGIVAGLVVFMAIARFLRSFLYGVAPNDPLTLTVATVTLIAVAALASWIPARRASRVDPASTLRAE